MSVTMLVMTDGRRECIDKSIDAALANLQGKVIEQVIICDDSGDREYQTWLWSRFPSARLVDSPERLGFAGAMRRAWATATACKTEHVFWLEDDFIIQRPVDLAAMTQVLDADPGLSQIVLKRQAWWGNEVEAGGIIEYQPAAHHDMSDGPHDWVEHALGFWTNPFLARRDWMLGQQWPDTAHSEAVFGMSWRKQGWRSAYWGKRDDPPLVEHIGIRQGTGY